MGVKKEKTRIYPVMTFFLAVLLLTGLFSACQGEHAGPETDAWIMSEFLLDKIYCAQYNGTKGNEANTVTTVKKEAI